MKKSIFTSLFLTLFTTFTFSQHPNFFLKDVFDATWLQNSKIKTLTSGKSIYKITNGVPVSTKATNISFKKKNTFIRRSQGHGKFHIESRLSPTTNQLTVYKAGKMSSYFFYDQNGGIEYKVNNADVKGFGAKYVQKYRLEEFIKDAKDRIIKKEIYDYKSSLIPYKNDLNKMKTLDRKLTEKWDYQYDKKNRLSEIKVSILTKGDVWNDKTITVEYENEFPTLVKMNQGNGDSQKGFFAQDRKFTYSFD